MIPTDSGSYIAGLQLSTMKSPRHNYDIYNDIPKAEL